MAEISRRRSIAERFPKPIFGELRRGGILESRRAGRGWYCLARPAEEVTVLDIVEIQDSEVRPARYSGGGGRHVGDARVTFEGVFDRYGIAQLAGAERGSPDRQ